MNEAVGKDIEVNGIYYSIDMENKTAVLSRAGANSPSSPKIIIIPRSISYQSKEYVITRILNSSFQFRSIRTVQFAPDSAIEVIEVAAFSRSSIETISIPPHLTEIGNFAFSDCQNLKEVKIPPNSELKRIGEQAFCNTAIESLFIPSKTSELCSGFALKTPNLNKVHVMEGNEYFMSHDDKFIYGKSDKMKENFDVLVLAVKNIESNLTIPSFIETISSFSFSDCVQLKSIEFSADSKIEVIEKAAFYDSGIEKVTIPPSLVDLEWGWCMKTPNLTTVTFLPENQYYIMSKDDEFIYEENSDDQIVLNFARRDIRTAVIHPVISVIESFAFEGCRQLQEVEIEEDSVLKKICKYAFQESSIKRIFIPKLVKIIETKSFFNCYNIQKVEFSKDSELTTIKSSAFEFSSIRSIKIPPHVTRICKSAFANCKELREVIFHPNSELAVIENGVFRESGIRSISIPPHLTTIELYAFAKCKSLSNIEIPQNSQLSNIGYGAFASTKIERFTIPPLLAEVGHSVFDSCSSLTKVDFPDNSQTSKITLSAFDYSGVRSLIIPACVTEIDRIFGENCEQLLIVEIDENNGIDEICPHTIQSYILMIPVNLKDRIVSNKSFY
ncbi:hypothetical protein M9Y10_032397 [Tritrichomonas musculus]|uniref:Surface antigen BspA-like n=1 Tax=Tritrichomonas musculus TaxID=1915356 RepID=A0ABR2GZ59_9EUKA